VVRVIEQWHEAELSIETAGVVVDGINLDSPDADVFGEVLNPP
jgi:hypothetical protein